MDYRIIFQDLIFFSDFEEGYKVWAKSKEIESLESELIEKENIYYHAFADVGEDIWKKIDSGDVIKLPIQWYDGDPYDLFGKEFSSVSTIETGSITFNDDETVSGAIIICDGNGKWVRKMNMKNIKIQDPGRTFEDYEQELSEMTLEEYRSKNDELILIPFSKDVSKNQD